MVLLLLSVVFLAVELRRSERAASWVFASGVIATLGVALAVLRPVAVISKSSPMGPRLVVLVDESRRMLLPSDDASKTRADVAKEALAALKEHYKEARLGVLGFVGTIIWLYWWMLNRSRTAPPPKP